MTNGISARPLSGGRPEFTEYFADACATQLRRTLDADRLAPQALRPPWWATGPIPGFAVRAIQHDRARELLEITERPGARAAFAVYAAGLRAGPRALAGRRGLGSGRAELSRA